MERTVPLSTILSGLLIASADTWWLAIWLARTTSAYSYNFGECQVTCTKSCTLAHWLARISSADARRLARTALADAWRLARHLAHWLAHIASADAWLLARHLAHWLALIASADVPQLAIWLAGIASADVQQLAIWLARYRASRRASAEAMRASYMARCGTSA